MKVIKLALFSFLSLFLLIWLISLLIPSDIRISRAVDIGAPKDSVMAMIRDAGRWRSWYPGMESAKPLMEQGKMRGMILSEQEPGKPVYIELEKETADEVTAVFVNNKLKPVLNTWQVIGHPGSDSITVQWYMDFNLRWYPWEKFASLVLEKSNGSKMEDGLGRLKKKVHANLSSNN